MSLLETIYGLIARSFRYRPVKKIKNILRPVKHFLLGKDGIYRAIDIVKEQNGGDDILVVFDIGAAVGDTALTFLRSFPQAKVYCFEPHRESFLRLQKRTAQFGERVHCFNFGLYDKEAELDFFVNKESDSSSFIPLSSDSTPPKEVRKVKVRRLDDVARELGVRKIDFLKIDVERAERNVLEGGRNILQQTENVFVEILPCRKGLRSHDYIEVFECLHEAGLDFAGVYGDFFFSRTL